MKDVFIIDTGLANLRSVEAALERLGCHPRRVRNATDVSKAIHLVLPGVGAFGPAMITLHRENLASALRQRVLAGRPTLAICLGLQLLCGGSDENPGIAGLGVLPARVSALPPGARVPNMGWLPLAGGRDHKEQGPHAYFAHSYAITAGESERLWVSGWQVLTANHGGPYVAAARKGAVLACQFHPELSGDWGQRLLAAWLDSSPGKEMSWPA